jgi:hypothetical protein
MHRIERRYQSAEDVPVRKGSVLLLPGNTSILERVSTFRFERYKRMAYDDTSNNYEPFTLLTPALQRKFASRERTEAVSLLHALQSEVNQLQQPEVLLGIVKRLIDRKMIDRAEAYLQSTEGVLKRTYQLLKGVSTFLDQIAPLYDRFQDDDVVKTLSNIREAVDRFTKLKDSAYQTELREQLIQLKDQISEAKAAPAV